MSGAPDLLFHDSGGGAHPVARRDAGEGGGRGDGRRVLPPRDGHSPDAGLPLHLHHGVDEAFYVLDGTYEFVCGDRSVEAGPGAFVLLPRGVPHRYRSGHEGGRMLMLFSPGGTEAYFRDLAAAMSEGELAADEFARLAERHGIQFFGDY